MCTHIHSTRAKLNYKTKCFYFNASFKPALAALTASLIWDWPLAAKQWDQTRTGFIIVTFFGDQNASGDFALSIAAMPPLKVHVSVYRDLTAWEEIVKKISDILSNLKTILLTIVAIVGILVGWKTKFWKWFSNR